MSIYWKVRVETPPILLRTAADIIHRSVIECHPGLPGIVSNGNVDLEVVLKEGTLNSELEDKSSDTKLDLLRANKTCL